MNYYDSIAQSYNELYGEEQLKKWELCKNLINIDGLVLDAGCGTGIITKKIKNVIGVDNSAKLLAQCDNNLNVVHADLENLPFETNKFDTIVSFTVLQDIKNIEIAVNELYRVLKPKGNLLISVLDKNKIENVRTTLHKKFKNLKEKKIEKDVVFFRQK